jgi:hypothetical protein
MFPVRFLLVCLLFVVGAGRADPNIPWVGVAGQGEPRVQIYFFWSKRCPHCLQALPFVQRLERDHPWLEVHSLELTSDRANVARYVAMAAAIGEEARAVPAFLVCGRMLTGFDSPDGIGQQLLALARQCRPDPGSQDEPVPTGGGRLAPGEEAGQGGPIRLPVLGEVSAANVSLPLFTLVIAGLDAFNPCAFFVLLFLLSLMVHARSRGRMLLIGGTFVFFSGAVYFLFMAAWLNLFLVVGAAPTVTLVAGGVALAIGLLNVKDYYWLRRGPSLAIPQGAKPGLFRHMRGLLAADNTMAMLVGTVTLALAANSYELLCTAGFPMVYTRVLTLNAPGGVGYYAYLLLYNLIYVLPLLAIVAVFATTLGARKLSEREGRVLKLLSGVMMFGLGVVLLVAPERLSNPWVGAALLALALATTLVVTFLEGRRGVREKGSESA